MKNNDKNNLYIISIVAIVAIVAMVFLVNLQTTKVRSVVSSETDSNNVGGMASKLETTKSQSTETITIISDSKKLKLSEQYNEVCCAFFGKKAGYLEYTGSWNGHELYTLVCQGDCGTPKAHINEHNVIIFNLKEKEIFNNIQSACCSTFGKGPSNVEEINGQVVVTCNGNKCGATESER